jgi:hypothetical protein
MSGVDTNLINAAISSDPEEIDGRSLQVWIGFFAADNLTLTPLDSLYSLGHWEMQRPTFEYSDVGDRSISLAAETLFIQRDRAVFGMMSDRDQRRRYADDGGLEFMPSLKNRVVRWPQW